MTVYGNYDVIAFRSCIQIFTVWDRALLPYVFVRSDFVMSQIGMRASRVYWDVGLTGILG